MNSRQVRARFAVLVCLFFAILLTIVPLPSWASWFRPLWVLMTLCYWSLALDNYRGITVAFFSGIVLDILGGSLLGEHALILVLLMYIVMRLKRQILMYSLSQQSLFVLLLALVYQILIYIIEGIVGNLPKTILFWAPLITTPLFWPWVYIILRDYRRWFNIT